MPALVPLPAHAPWLLVLIKHPDQKIGHLPEAGGHVFFALGEQYSSIKAALWDLVPTNIYTGQYLHLFVYTGWFWEAE